MFLTFILHGSSVVTLTAQSHMFLILRLLASCRDREFLHNLQCMKFRLCFQTKHPTVLYHMTYFLYLTDQHWVKIVKFIKLWNQVKLVSLGIEIHKVIVVIRGGIKNCFFYFRSNGGRGSRPKEKKLSENTQIFLTKRGGLTQSKRVLSDFLA